MNIDEAGRHHLPCGIDDALRLPAPAVVNRHDTSGADRHIGDPAGCATTVDDFPPTNQQIVHPLTLRLHTIARAQLPSLRCPSRVLDFPAALAWGQGG
jgi:hypothetical protein